MDLSSNEEFPIDIQISGGAREINEICPPPTPPIFKFYIYRLIFMKLDIAIASIDIVWLIGYKINKLPPLPPSPILNFLIYRLIFMKLNT